MIELDFRAANQRPPRFMFIGAHCDDIEIGCGGTVIELTRRYPDATVYWVVLSSEGERKAEAEEAAAAILHGVRNRTVIIRNFRGAFFPSEAVAIKEFFEELKTTCSPDVVFAHYRDDLHQDHRIVAELAWNTFRDHVILEYEIPKYDGGLGSPSVFVPLAESTVNCKVDLLMRTFRTQLSKRWFTPETFRGLMRLRGIESNALDGYAEAFYSRKLVLRTMP